MQKSFLFLATKVTNPEFITDLIGQGIDVNSHDDYGRTALHKALEFKNLNAVQTLIKNGANVNQRDRAGVTPLMIAVSTDNLSCLSALLEAKPKINWTTEYRCHVFSKREVNM